MNGTLPPWIQRLLGIDAGPGEGAAWHIEHSWPAAPWATVLIVVFLVGRTLDHAVLGLEPREFLLFGLLLYAVLFSNNFVNNAFAWENDGINSYFICPVSPQRILAGKNLAVWIYSLLLFVICIATWSAVKGVPDLHTLLVGLLLYFTCLLTFTSTGNFVSVLFPVSRNISTDAPIRAAVTLRLLASFFHFVLSGGV